jgi:dipeptidyl aminopeptidase/acylaminoacyl peptidase
MRRTFTLVGAAVTVALGTGLAANAASQAGNGFRGANGRVVYEAGHGFALVNPDGSGSVAMPNPARYEHSPAWSPNGQKLAFQGFDNSDLDIFVMDGDGSHRRQLTFSRVPDEDPSWSGDGRTIAFESGQGSTDVWTIRADGSHLQRLTTEPGFDGDPAISPDGTRIAFTSDRDGNRELYVMNADGSDPTRLTNNGARVPNTAIDEVDENPAWSPDGTRIAFDSSRDGQFEIYSIRVDGTDVRRLTDHQSLDAAPSWSPDGRSIAYISDRAGKDYRDIWVMRANGGAPHRITHGAVAQSPPDWQALPAAPAGCTLWGTAGRDLIASGSRGDVICGLGGDDTLVGGRGADTLLGGTGNDTLLARDGRRDRVDGGAGRDRAQVDKKRDRVLSIESRLR